MKKYFLFSLLIAIVPSMVFGASARYTQLVREKQRKMEQLEKCMGSSKGLKIAGLSTIGLTAVGVAGNIYEAKTIKTNDTTIEKNEKKIEKKQQEIAEKQKEIAEKEAQAKILAECKNQLNSFGVNSDKIASVERGEDGVCKILTCVTGFKVSDDGTKCEKDQEKQEAAVNTDFKALCEGEGIGGKYSQNAIESETNAKGATIKVHIPVYASCTEIPEDVDLNIAFDVLKEKCAADQNNKHVNEGKRLLACLGDLEVQCVDNAQICYDKYGEKEEQSTETPENKSVSKNKISEKLEQCKSDVSFAGVQKWTFGKAVEDNFRNMASSYKLAVEDDTEIFNQHKTTIYQEIFAELKQKIDESIIPNEEGYSFSCNGITIRSDSCGGKTYKDCFNPFYECKLDVEKMKAESRAKDKYIEALTQSICYKSSL